MFLEMARALASDVVGQSTASDERIATTVFRRILTRPPRSSELAAILKFRQRQLERLRNGELSPVSIGGSSKATAELAAWVMVVRSVMNLDEAITKG